MVVHDEYRMIPPLDNLSGVAKLQQVGIIGRNLFIENVPLCLIFLV